LFLEDIFPDFQDCDGKVEDADEPIGDPHQQFASGVEFAGEDDSQPDCGEDHEDADGDGEGSEGKVVEEELLVVMVLFAEVLSEFDELGAV
jgi:hypothetical protein